MAIRENEGKLDISKLTASDLIPMPAPCQCNGCKKRAPRGATCPLYPEWIPHKVLVGTDCPEFEAK